MGRGKSGAARGGNYLWICVMPCYVNYTEEGRIVGCVKCESDVPTVKIEGILSMEVNEEVHDQVAAQVGTDAFYVQNGELVPFPTKPSPHHEWDWTTKSWLPNLDAAREAKKQEASSELSRRLYLPCNGFDADKVSRERISGMIARLQRGDGLPAGWVGWRDASNQQQWVTDDAATVLANLTALSRAIEDREQALLVASWTHKANIAALADIDAIIGYDVTANWPV